MAFSSPAGHVLNRLCFDCAFCLFAILFEYVCLVGAYVDREGTRAKATADTDEKTNITLAPTPISIATPGHANFIAFFLLINTLVYMLQTTSFFVVIQ